MEYKNVECDICGDKDRVMGVLHYNACAGCLFTLLDNTFRFKRYLDTKKE
tara:strand:+ start:20053 stop:20202 length:150 start_codon:yes stop_codon:yes gene_type:complete